MDLTTRTRDARADLGLPSGMVVQERGAGPTVVLVHGIGVSGRYFGRLVVVPDLLGFGSSARPREVLSVEEHAHSLEGILRAPGIERPVLVGHSMGAQVVTEMAARNPGLAAGVVLIGPVTEPGARSASRLAWRLLRDARHETLEGNALMVSDWLRTGPRRYGATVPTMLAYPTGRRIAEVQEPVVLLRGEHDPVTPRDFLADLARSAPDASVLEVPGEGHVALRRRPDMVASVVRGLV